MGYHIDGQHVRVRTNLARDWIWQLITEDGHVAFESEPYRCRDACESDAKRQGLPIVGGRRALDRALHKRARSEGVRVYNDNRGIWKWELVDSQGRIAYTSTLGFLTREECERDSERHSQLSMLQSC